MRNILPFVKVTFQCRWEEQPLQPMSPLVWRDRIEWQFKKIACITIRRRCDECSVRKGCIVSFLFTPSFWFEGKLPSASGSIPLPWVPSYPDTVSEKNFTLAVTLIGEKAISVLPYWFVAIDRLGKTNRQRFELVSVMSDTGSGQRILYEAEHGTFFTDPGISEPRTFAGALKLRLDILTPLKILSAKKPLLTPSFKSILQSIKSRCVMLGSFYGEGEIKFDYDPTALESVSTEMLNVHWHEQHLFSKKQKETISLSGLTGSLVFEGDLEPFGLLLGMGEYLGIGKGTALGLGRYELQAV